MATLQGVEEEVFQLSSSDTGYEYEITVLLPPNYDDSQTYPSVYLLDGHWHYPHAAADAQRMMNAGEIEPILLISIAYALEDTQVDPKYYRNYLAARRFDNESTGKIIALLTQRGEIAAAAEIAQVARRLFPWDQRHATWLQTMNRAVGTLGSDN